MIKSSILIVNLNFSVSAILDSTKVSAEQRSRDLGDIVQSAPNKTVSDIHHSDCIDCRTVQKLLADTGIGDLDLGPEFLSDLTRRSHSPNVTKYVEEEGSCTGTSGVDNERVPDELLGACAADDKTGNESSDKMTIIDFDGASVNNINSTPGGVFGIIKDISVSNIDFGENEKLSNKPRIIDSVTNNHDNCVSRTSNKCWSTIQNGQIRKSSHDESESSELLDQAIGGKEETSAGEDNLPLPNIHVAEEEEDEGLSLTKFIKELSLKGCENDENIPSQEQSFTKTTSERHPLDFPPRMITWEDNSQTLDLDMSVRSGYNSSAKPSQEMVEAKHTIDQDLSIVDFDEEMQEAEEVVSNFLNAQLLKNFPLESQFDNLEESSDSFVSASASELQVIPNLPTPPDHELESPSYDLGVSQDRSRKIKEAVNEDSSSTFV